MTELVFILDRSGSMSGLEADTIGGFNSMIAQQKKESGEALVSTVLFANDSTVIHDRLPLGKVPPLTEKEYFTCGCSGACDASPLSCFLFRPRKSREKRRKRSYINVSSTLSTRSSTPPAQTAHVRFHE